jgi:hypothetical protein
VEKHGSSVILFTVQEFEAMEKKNGFKLSALLSPPQELKESFWVEGPVRNNA